MNCQEARVTEPVNAAYPHDGQAPAEISIGVVFDDTQLLSAAGVPSWSHGRRPRCLPGEGDIAGTKCLRRNFIISSRRNFPQKSSLGFWPGESDASGVSSASAIKATLRRPARKHSKRPAKRGACCSHRIASTAFVAARAREFIYSKFGRSTKQQRDT